jgi:putative ABC transport system ATP-binding protein
MAMMPVPTIIADDLYRFYHSRDEETRALRGVSFAVNAGEFVALVGPSGSGKSTLLACLAGLDVPDGGQVVLKGERIARLSEHERSKRRRDHIGVLLQSGNLLSGLTAEENVRLPILLSGRGDLDQVASLLELVGIWGRHAALPSQLSGGETARVGLAVALAHAPDLILADEPTAEVDAATERDVVRLLAKRCEAGMTAIIATHSQTLAATATRVIELQEGRVINDRSARTS